VKPKGEKICPTVQKNLQKNGRQRRGFFRFDDKVKRRKKTPPASQQPNPLPSLRALQCEDDLIQL
jgi:hypothetical protein